VAAEIISLADFRDSADAECDLVTAVDVAIRDIREILANWGTDQARIRAVECERLLSLAFRNGTFRLPEFADEIETS
jgi:hypothetical protein